MAVSVRLRVDDFRCHDPNLVHVLPGRELEAVCVARQLLDQGVSAGLFVQGDGVSQWGFLDEASGLDRFEFVNFSATLSCSKLTAIKHATSLRIVGSKLAMDFSAFESLETLHYQWSPKSTGLQRLKSLKNAFLYEIGAATNAWPLPLPATVEKLLIVNYRHEFIEFVNSLDRLVDVSVIYARNLLKLPCASSLKQIELKNVGRDSFPYETLPEGLTDIWIEACAPILDWGFVEKMRNLKRLVVLKTGCAPPSELAAEWLKLVPMRDLPLGIE